MTKDERREAAETRRKELKDLSATIKAMTELERLELIQTYGAKTCEGHTLSDKNTLLLIMQARALHAECPTVVAGFKQWKRNGRTVRKGQHGLSIYVPCKRKAEKNDDGDEKPRKTFFKSVRVFDITQTEESGTGEAAPAATPDKVDAAPPSRFVPVVVDAPPAAIIAPEVLPPVEAPLIQATFF